MAGFRRWIIMNRRAFIGSAASVVWGLSKFRLPIVEAKPSKFFKPELRELDGLEKIIKKWDRIHYNPRHSQKIYQRWKEGWKRLGTYDLLLRMNLREWVYQRN